MYATGLRHIPNYYFYDKLNVVQFILSFATTD
jgi:hypothetical protein